MSKTYFASAAILATLPHANVAAAPIDTQQFAAAKVIIVTVAERKGIDPGAFSRMAQIESGWNPAAYHPKSGAAGLFQFVPKTARAYGLTNPFDAQANAEAAAQLWKDNEARLEKALGRKPSAGEIYLAHQQGAGGAIALLMRPNSPAALIVGKKAVEWNGGRRDMTAGEFANYWIAKFERVR
ncbi:hypothetical protein ASG52_11680 [Methylobacterium sp. Leaf456]|uniref:transglycosylase SLT domain-containing protein n=1 Tax=Methylobacterium sp. Leaf456 TaxID=1736382 RepID=UPI0006FB825E|nr:transglycosylase SLT domain-containing protein [Methylobacterium sp. Leaf456]KQT47912.1 hypothetical protein ASG52_11680 [Methylobacterium sp. Leaf456]